MSISKRLSLPMIIKLKEIMKKNPGKSLLELSHLTNIPKTTLSRYLNINISDIVKRINNRYFLVGKTSNFEKEVLNYEAAKKYACELRREGYSFSEISSIIQKKFNIGFSETSSFELTKSIKMSDKGKKRFSELNIYNKSKAGKNGGLALVKSGKWKKGQRKAVLAAVKSNTFIPPLSSRMLSMHKVRIMSHLFFDGCVRNSEKEKYICYTNCSKSLISQFESDMFKVYGVTPSFKSEKMEVKYCYKKIVEDFMNYSPSFSTSPNSNPVLPIQIINSSKKLKRVFLRAFWDDEGAIRFGNDFRKDGYRHKRLSLEAFCANTSFLQSISKLHNDLGVIHHLQGNKLIISGVENVRKFKELIGFSEGVFVNFKSSLWDGVEKCFVLNAALSKPRKVFFESYGCTANFADLDQVKELFFRMGWVEAKTAKESEIIVLNTCAVKNPTENKMIDAYKRLSKEGKKILITGCLPKANLPRIKKQLPGFFAAIDSFSIDKIPSIISDLDKGLTNIVYFSDSSNYLNQLTKTTSITKKIRIANGCYGSCAFCCVKNVKGILRSKPVKDIKVAVENAVKKGAKEIQLTAEDTGIYGWDIQTDLPTLLNELTSIPGDFQIRVGMMDPFAAKKLGKKLLKAFDSPKIFKFLHIPIQSGSDKVLKLMRRKSSRQDFFDLVNVFRKKFPDMTISTDIIVGFPGETKEDFNKTLSLLKKTRPDVTNVSKFYPRPDTEASKMKKIPTPIIKERSVACAKLCAQISFGNHKRFVGRELDITVLSTGKFSNFVGRTHNYLPVIVSAPLGSKLRVRISRAFSSYLKGNIINT